MVRQPYTWSGSHALCAILPCIGFVKYLKSFVNVFFKMYDRAPINSFQAFGNFVRRLFVPYMLDFHMFLCRVRDMGQMALKLP